MKKITLLAMSLMMALVVNAQETWKDVTSSFTNPDFEEGSSNGWTITGPEGGQNLGTANTAASNNFQGIYFMEAWCPSERAQQGFTWSQTKDMPNGYYVVKALAHAIRQNDESLVPTGIYLFAENNQTQVTTIRAAEYAVFTSVTDGSLTIGLSGTGCNSNWIACDDFRVIQFFGDTEDAAKAEWAKYECNLLVDELNSLVENRMSAALKKEITASIAAIETVTTYAEAEALWTKMKQQKEDATACVEAYENLVLKIEEVYGYAEDYEERGYDTGDLYDAADDADEKYSDELFDVAGALAEIEALNQAVFLFNMSIANGEIAFDVTEMYLTNPTLRQNSNGWKGSTPGLEYEVMEFYDCDFDIYQELTGIPNGKYVVMVQGFYREKGNDSGEAHAASSEKITAQLYANNASAPLLSLYKYKASEMGVTSDQVSNDYVNMRVSTNEAFNSFNSLEGVNYYTENKVEVIVFDGTLKIGLKNTGHQQYSWCAFRDFKLYYYGNFPAVNLAGKFASIKDYIAKNGDAIPYAAWMKVDEFLYEYEGYAEEGAASDEEVDAVIIALDELWNETLESVDLFAELKAQVSYMENDLIALDYAGKDILWDLIEEAEYYFGVECEDNTYEALVELKAKLDAGIKDYYQSQVATPEIAADYTIFVPNPNFEEKGEWTWNITSGGSDLWVGPTNGGNNIRPTEEGGDARYGVNLWGWGITSVDVHQTLTNLPNGLYKVSAELITQSGYATDQHVYATGANTATSDYLIAEGWDAYEWTTLTTNDFAVVVDGTLTIGAAASKGGSNSEGWFQATNFKLYYHGPASEEHLQAAWESVKAKATEAVEIMLPSEKKELVAALQEATPLGEATKYAEACALLSPVVTAWDSTIVATKNFYDGYYAKLDTIRLYDAYEGCEMVYSFADASIALADALLASDTTTCKVFPGLHEQLHAYANYASSLRDAENAINDTENLYREEFENFVIDSVITPQVDSLTLRLRTIEFCDELRGVLDKAVGILKGTLNMENMAVGDVTYLIVNPTIDVTDGVYEGWTAVKNNAQNCGTNQGEHYSGVTTDTYLDAWAGSGMNATFYQEINGILDGTYRVTVAARTDGDSAFVFAASTSAFDDESTNFVLVKNYGAWRGEIWKTDSLQWEKDGRPTDNLIEDYPYYSARFNNQNGWGEGYGWSYDTIDVVVTNHYLAIGITADKELSGKKFGGTWMGADDWKLELVEISEVQSEFKPFGGLDYDIEFDSVEETVAAPAVNVIYDLFGRRIETVTVPGIYIVNGKKMVIK